MHLNVVNTKSNCMQIDKPADYYRTVNKYDDFVQWYLNGAQEWWPENK